MVMQLDHTVINVRFDMDAAEQAFKKLGFTLTARGFHSLGSINHLMMFDTDYLELIGLPEAAKAERPDIAASPLGFNGLVFKTDDADKTFERLQAIGMDGNPAKAFYRPVALPEGEENAHFRTTHVRPDVFEAGRVYFCEHATPELVWRPEWQAHANQAKHIDAYVVVAADPRREADRYAQLTDAADPEETAEGYRVALQGGALWVMSEAAYARRYGDLALSADGRKSRFGALVLASGDLQKTAEVIAAAGDGFQHRTTPSAVHVQAPAFHTLIEFQ